MVPGRQQVLGAAGGWWRWGRPLATTTGTAAVAEDAAVPLR